MGGRKPETSFCEVDKMKRGKQLTPKDITKDFGKDSTIVRETIKSLYERLVSTKSFNMMPQK